MLRQLLPADLAELMLTDEVSSHILLDQLCALELDLLDNAQQIVCVSCIPRTLNTDGCLLSDRLPSLKSVPAEVLSSKGLNLDGRPIFNELVSASFKLDQKLLL